MSTEKTEKTEKTPEKGTVEKLNDLRAHVKRELLDPLAEAHTKNEEGLLAMYRGTARRVREEIQELEAKIDKERGHAGPALNVGVKEE